MKDRKSRLLWVSLVLLAIAAPLGLILPEYFGGKGAWGEDSSQIKEEIGEIPEGMKQMSGIWRAPLPSYETPRSSDQPRSRRVRALQYSAFALLGIACCGLFTSLLGQLLIRTRNDETTGPKS